MQVILMIDGDTALLRIHFIYCQERRRNRAIEREKEGVREGERARKTEGAR